MSNQKPIELRFLMPGDQFQIRGWGSKYGELIECFEYGDAKVRIINGTKSEVSWFCQRSEVYLLNKNQIDISEDVTKYSSIQEAVVIKPAVDQTKPKESVKPVASGKDKYGCNLASASGKINSAVSNTPQTMAEIAAKAGVEESRAKAHLKYWMKKKEKIGQFLKEENGKYYIK